MSTTIEGKVFVVGDNIDTDVIIPARYLTTMDPNQLGKHAMEDLDPKQNPIKFLNPNGTCDYRIVIAGRNFGCGSSREHAPIALKAAGIDAVVAASFARIYYRNSVNGGIILPLESEQLPEGQNLTARFKTGDIAQITLDESRPEIKIIPGDTKFGIKPFGPVMQIVKAGGLTAYNKARVAAMQANRYGQR